MSEIIRYSDEDLQEFKTLILEKLEQANQNLEMAEDAGQRAQRQQEFINKLQAALTRIENKTYGICRVTGKLIPKGRLLAVPHATTSLEGKEIEQARKRR